MKTVRVELVFEFNQSLLWEAGRERRRGLGADDELAPRSNIIYIQRDVLHRASEEKPLARNNI